MRAPGLRLIGTSLATFAVLANLVLVLACHVPTLFAADDPFGMSYICAPAGADDASGVAAGGPNGVAGCAHAMSCCSVLPLITAFVLLALIGRPADGPAMARGHVTAARGRKVRFIRGPPLSV